jgi:peptide/nickel transport system permease protein
LLRFIFRRILQVIPTLILISITSFLIIQLPEGDFVSDYIAGLQFQGIVVTQNMEDGLRLQYGLDRSVVYQYFKWVSGLLRGDLGYSFAWNAPVSTLIWPRVGLTFGITLLTLIFTWAVAFPIGIYSATHQYSMGDYSFTLVGFIGLATPNFMIALVFMWIFYTVFGQSVGGLFSPEFESAAWSLAKFWDLLKHLWIPIIVVGTAGTAGLIRILRANLLDEINKPYVEAAMARGVTGKKLLYKYPVRVAVLPFVSTIGWSLPRLVSGYTITAVVLSLPTTGPLLLDALQAQDMYLAGSIIMILSILTVIGTFISDILLGWVDPRIRHAQGSQ